MLFGVWIPVPIGLLIILYRKCNEAFSENFFKKSVERIYAEMTHITRLLNEVASELEYAEDLLERELSDGLVRARVKQLVEERELLKDKKEILNLVLMAREKREFYERHCGKGIWKKISNYPADVWKDIKRKTLDKYGEKELNVKALRDLFIETIEKEIDT